MPTQKEQETVRSEVVAAQSEIERARGELRRRQQSIVQIVADTEQLARSNVGVLHAKRRLDAEQVSL